MEPYGQMKGGSAAISAAAKLTIKIVLLVCSGFEY